MEITVRKMKMKDIKKLTRIIKKIGVDFFNVDLEKKEEAGLKIVKVIIEKYEDVETELVEFIATLSGLTNKQIEELDIDELIDIFKKIWEKNNIMGFLKSES